MNNLFSDMLDSGLVMFLDNILAYSHMEKEHIMQLKQILVRLCQYIFYYKLRMCSFLHNSTIFFGFDITPEGMHISDSKVCSLNKWSVPTIVK